MYNTNMAKTTSNQHKTSAQLQTELDELLAWFESDDVDLDEAVAKYEQGQAILKELQARLRTAENTIKNLSID